MTTTHRPPNPAVPALAALAAFAFMLIVPTALRDGDTGWHIAAGEWIVAHARVPTTDPFSYTAAGQPWVAHEWLSEAAMYAAFAAAGWSGVIALYAAALGALFAILAAYLTRWTTPRATVCTLLLVALGLLPSMLARPHMLVLPILAAWTVSLLRARETSRAPPLVHALLMLAWANMHGSFIFGIGIAGLFAIEALLTAADRPAVFTAWGLFGIATTLAALVTPSGMHGLLFPFYLGDLRALDHIGEWQPSSFLQFSGFEFILLATLFVLLIRPTRIPPIRLLLMLGMLHMTLRHTRQEIVLVVVGAALLAEPLGRVWTSTPRHLPDTWREARPLLCICLVLALALGGYRLAVPVVRGDSPGIPETALRHLPSGLGSQHVFNGYDFGGSLIQAGIRPYIDGRVDMYGDAFSLDYFRIEKGDVARFARADARWHFGWTILPPRNALNLRLDSDPAWRRIYADDTAVIHVRRTD